ncbi:MAG: hypothetical protein SFX73_33230 [Kofleriaceae bacterium]|nr:hypothetical protein [Kofleriaceae bacterium]
MRAWSVMAAAVSVSGCLRASEYRCNANAECIQAGTQGRCGPAGYCAFDDDTCDSGLRYGALAGGGYANACVAGGDAMEVVDAPIDAPPPIDARECFGSGAYALCFDGAPPMGMITLAGTLDTDTDARCAAMPASWALAGQPDACLIAANAIMVTGNVAVTGSTNRRPLVLVAQTVTIGATLDVASHRSPPVNAIGAPAAQCQAFPMAPVSATNGAGGGAGGSFMRAGGPGGHGESSGSTGGVAASADSAAPTILRAGCPGQQGGDGVAPAGAPGMGGGAIYIAANLIAFSSSGIINASGSGAHGGGTTAGGSGGGSGGMIVLYSSELTMATGARLLANGGGGSGGADGGTGAVGADPTATSPTSAASGGNGPGANGGAGFAGSASAQAGGSAGGSRESAGGGGGGGGYIQSNHPLTGATVSPAATIVP